MGKTHNVEREREREGGGERGERERETERERERAGGGGGEGGLGRREENEKDCGTVNCRIGARSFADFFLYTLSPGAVTSVRSV